MANNRRLRAVRPNEGPRKTPPQKPKGPVTVSEAVSRGTRRDELVAMRARIARAIDEPNIRGADLAALSRRLLEVGKEIEAIDVALKQEAAEGGDVADEQLDAEAL